ATQTILPGFETSYEVTATLVPGGTTPATTFVEPTVSGCPTGVSCFFNRSAIVPQNPPDSTSSATLIIRPAGSIAAGSYPLTITATGGGTTRTTTVTLVVTSLTPTAPTNLTATAVLSTQVALSWQDNSDNENDFRIERRTTTGSYVQIVTAAANTTT